MGTVFAIFMIFFGLAYVYLAVIGTNDIGMICCIFYLGFMCLAIAFICSFSYQ